MTHIERAIDEMRRRGIAPDEIEVFAKILTLFFDKFDSGGSVHVAAMILGRLIAGSCLTPLTRDEEEWADRSRESGYPIRQNERHGLVFQEVGGAYDLSSGKKVAINFPYWPTQAEWPFPIMEAGGWSGDVQVASALTHDDPPVPCVQPQDIGYGASLVTETKKSTE